MLAEILQATQFTPIRAAQNIARTAHEFAQLRQQIVPLLPRLLALLAQPVRIIVKALRLRDVRRDGVPFDAPQRRVRSDSKL